MRYDLKKYLFVGLASEKEAFFKQAQKIGVIHFIDSRNVKIKETNEVQYISDAIKILRGLPPVEQEFEPDYDEADTIAKKINELNDQLKKLTEEERLLRLEIGRVGIFGDFSWEDVNQFEKEGKLQVQFFTGKRANAEGKEGIIYIGTLYGLDYFVALNKQKRSYEKLVELHIEKPLGDLKSRLADVHKEIHDIDRELKQLAKYNTYLHHFLIIKLNSQQLHNAQNFVQLPLDDLFAVEAWVPVNKEKLIHPLVEKMSVYAEEIAIDPNDTIPTYLENTGTSRIGEDLVHIYDIPSHTDKDPSPWVLWFFALFFALIVGDAGYGLVFLITASYLWYKFSNAPAVGKRVIKLIFIIGSFCLVWGILINSFFGISLDINSPIRKVSLLQWLIEKKAAYHMRHQDEDYKNWVKKFPQLAEVKDPHEFISKAVKVDKHGNETNELLDTYSRSIMMELALLIGVIHLMLSFMRYLGRNWSGAGWILVLIGGYLYAPTFVGATSLFYIFTDVPTEVGAKIGLQLVGVGMIIAVGLAIFKHKLLGIFEVMTVIQIFADVMSYLRLFALGLAGGIVSATINELASGIPFVFAVILVICAHIINIVLGIMSGLIHGLRLNFLEWYHYSFEGGGKPFQPLRLFKIE